MSEPRYRHQQVGWMTVAAAGTLVALAGALLLFAGATLLTVAVLGVLVLILVLFARLVVTVTDREVTAAFNLGFPSRRIALSDVRTFHKVRNPWIYGWGVRGIPGGWMFNVSGLDAVELVLVTGRRFRIGTDEPEALLTALVEAAGEPGPLDTEQELHQARQARVLGWVLAGLVIVIVAAIAFAIWREVQPVETKVSESHLIVRHNHYAVSEIAAVELIDTLPTIEARTNGFAFGNTLHGWFRLADWGEGQLFIRHGEPPYVIVRMKPGVSPAYVVINRDDPAETRKLHADLGAAIE